MVVPTQGLTSLSPSGTTPIGLQARLYPSLAWASAGEHSPTPSSQMGIGEGRSKTDLRPEPNRPKVPVVDKRGVSLMPCKPVRARLLLKSGKDVARWNKIGIFYIQLKREVEPNNQTLAVGIDPDRKYKAIFVVGTRDTVLNIMNEAVDRVKKAMEQRRQMRRAKMYRKTRRECRFDNRLRNSDSLHPSTKARWDAKIRILEELKMIPIKTAAVEDVRAKAREGQKRWNTTLSPYYLVLSRRHSGELQRLKSEKGGIGRRYGGATSLGLKEGTLVKYDKYGLCCIGGNLKERFSLHSLKDGKRLTQNAKREDFKIKDILDGQIPPLNQFRDLFG